VRVELLNARVVTQTYTLGTGISFTTASAITCESDVVNTLVVVIFGSLLLFQENLTAFDLIIGMSHLLLALSLYQPARTVFV